MKKFNLLLNDWIPTIGGLVPLLDWRSIDEIVAPPMTRLAIVRLVMAINAWEGDRGASIDEFEEWFDLATAFQVGGLPAESARSARSIIDMVDGNNPALDPLPHRESSPALLAQALVTAYFCDRGGLKARAPGLPISAQCPLHVGKRVKMKRGSTLLELVDNNPVAHDDEKYQPPWVTGMQCPNRDIPSDELELLLWPWRRLQIHGDGITIAPGAKINKDTVDPWVIDKASLKHLAESDPEFEVTALVLNQASPIACWIS